MLNVTTVEFGFVLHTLTILLWHREELLLAHVLLSKQIT